jgi:hypothetical protein
MVQGVWQVPPSDDRASTPGGFDWISSPVVVGFALNASKPEELQAASAKPQITRAKARSSFISAFPRAAECRHPVACATIVPRSSLRANYRAASDRGRYSRWPARLLQGVPDVPRGICAQCGPGLDSSRSVPNDGSGNQIEEDDMSLLQASNFKLPSGPKSRLCQFCLSRPGDVTSIPLPLPPTGRRDRGAGP